MGTDFQRGKDPLRSMGLGVFYKEWRKKYDKKPIAAVCFELVDPHGNQKTYRVYLGYQNNHPDFPGHDTLYFYGGRLMGGWVEDKLQAPTYMNSNMQNQPTNFFGDGEDVEVIAYNNPQEFDKKYIDALESKVSKDWKMMLRTLSDEWFDEEDFFGMMRRWFATGVCSVIKIKVIPYPKTK